MTTIDAHIGGRIRERRLVLGQSGREVAEIIGVTTQQIHKYEAGIDRVSAGQLYVFAQVLGAPIASFFEGLDGKPTAGSRRRRLLLELMRNYSEIADKEHQEAISQVVRLLADR